MLEKRVLARSPPLNSATELIKTELVNYSLYNKYFGTVIKRYMFLSF